MNDLEHVFRPSKDPLCGQCGQCETDRYHISSQTLLRAFQDYRYKVGQTIYHFGGYKGLADNLGYLGDRVEELIHAQTGQK